MKKKQRIRIVDIRGRDEIRVTATFVEVKKLVRDRKTSILQRPPTRLPGKKPGKPVAEKKPEKPKRARKKKAEKEKFEKKVLKRLQKKLKTVEKKEEETLPLVTIKLARLDYVPANVVDHYIVGLKGIQQGGIGSHVYITRDGRYLVQDPVPPEEELEDLHEAVKILFFLTDSEKIQEIMKNEELFDEYLQEIGVSSYAAYLLKREVFGYGVLDPLIRDPFVEDFQVPRPYTPAKVLHRMHGALISNIEFTEAELDEYVEKMIHRAKKVISLFVPYASVQLPEGHRLTVCYKSEITTKGSNIVVRKFPEKPWSITRLFKFNSLSPEMAAWLMMLIEHKKGIIVAGVMSSGKTSTINGLCNLIPERATIVTIEDTPELRLNHRYWIQHKTREALTIDGKGSITMFDLVKHTLRESADYVIIGEVRGEEGRVWAQAIATGHGGITSFHAESPQTVITRLTSPPINVEKGLLTALYAIVMNKRFFVVVEEDGKRVKKTRRRTAAIYDVDYEEVGGDIRFRFTELFRYNPKLDIDDRSIPFEQVIDDLTETRSARSIMEEKGWTPEEFMEEYNKRLRLLRRLWKHVKDYPKTPLLEYEEVSRIFWTFYEDERKAYEIIEEIEKRLRKAREERGAPEEEKPAEEEKPRPRIRILSIEEAKG